MKSKTNKPSKPASDSLQLNCSAWALANKIAAQLFTTSDGQRANRFLFELDVGKILGSYTEEQATYSIFKVIQSRLKRKPGDGMVTLTDAQWKEMFTVGE